MSGRWDCVVVGGGVAGLEAALVLGRARRRTLLLDAGGQSNRPALHVGGLLGQEGVAPGELYARGREQLGHYESVAIRDAEAVDARAEGEGFVVTLAGGEELEARLILLATGMDYEVPDVPGFRDHWGDAVFHCPFCHGWEVRDRRIVVCDDGSTTERAALMRAWSEDVTVVPAGEIARLRAEDGQVRGVERRDGTVVECDAVFVNAPLGPRGHLAERLGLELSDDRQIAVDRIGRTSVPGVYASGDVAVAPQQVAIALASGHIAAIAAIRELVMGRS